MIHCKYVKSFLVSYWIQKQIKALANASVLWKIFLHSLPIIKEWLNWKVGRGIQIFVGIDPLIGLMGNYKLAAPLLHQLHSENIVKLKEIVIMMIL